MFNNFTVQIPIAAIFRRAKRLAFGVCLAMILPTSSFAEIGSIQPLDWGARFDSSAVRKAVFCVRLPENTSANGCATAFLISSSGYVLSASHVALAKDEWPQSDSGSLPPISRQRLIDAEGREYRFRVIRYPKPEQINKTVIKAENIVRMRLSPPPIVIKDFLEPELFGKFDVMLLKIEADDLHQLQRLNAEPLHLRANEKPLVSGERFFLAGFPWPPYNGAVFKKMLPVLSSAWPEMPPIKKTDGSFAFLTGKFKRTQDLTVITEATPEQIRGFDQIKKMIVPNSDAIDTFNGASGAPVLDADGAVVGVHWASDSSFGPVTSVKSTITFAVDIQQVRQEFELDELVKDQFGGIRGR